MKNESLFGARWTLYFVKNGSEITYAMHEESPLRMLGYLMKYYADGGKPIDSWSLHLHCNRKHQEVKLEPNHFTSDGKNITHSLLLLISAIDPGWRVEGAEPVFENATTKKSLPLKPLTLAEKQSQHRLSGSEQPTFASVMDEVFGR